MIISTSIHIAANGIILFFLRLSAILLCVCATSSLSFICWWTFRLLPHLSCSSPEFLKAYILFLSFPSTPHLCNWALDQNFPCNHFWFKSQRFQFSPVQSLSHVWLFATPWTAACQASLSITNSQSPPKPMSIESVMPSNHLILCCPLLLLPSIFPSIRVFKWVSSSHQVAKVLEFQLQHQSFQWTPRTDLL